LFPEFWRIGFRRTCEGLKQNELFPASVYARRFRRTCEGLKQLLGGAESHRRRFQTDL